MFFLPEFTTPFVILAPSHRRELLVISQDVLEEKFDSNFNVFSKSDSMTLIQSLCFRMMKFSSIIAFLFLNFHLFLEGKMCSLVFTVIFDSYIYIMLMLDIHF